LYLSFRLGYLVGQEALDKECLLYIVELLKKFKRLKNLTLDIPVYKIEEFGIDEFYHLCDSLSSELEFLETTF